MVSLGSMVAQLAIPYGGHRTPCIVGGGISVVGFELRCFEIEKDLRKATAKRPTRTEHQNSISRVLSLAPAIHGKNLTSVFSVVVGHVSPHYWWSGSEPNP